MNDRFLKDLNIDVVSGTSLTIDVQAIQPVDYGFYMLWIGQYTLWIGQFIPPITGTEAVFIKSNGVSYPVIDRAGNIVVAGKLRGGRRGCCHLEPGKYRLQFGSNGLEHKAHFVCYEGLKCMI